MVTTNVGLCPTPRFGRSRGPSAPLRSLAGLDAEMIHQQTCKLRPFAGFLVLEVDEYVAA
jgi:hypothetical protein